jgi:hypothetical protein
MPYIGREQAMSTLSEISREILFQKQGFLDFAAAKLTDSTSDGGKSLFGSTTSDYLGMQGSIRMATTIGSGLKDKFSYTSKRKIGFLHQHVESEHREQRLVNSYFTKPQFVVASDPHTHIGRNSCVEIDLEWKNASSGICVESEDKNQIPAGSYLADSRFFAPTGYIIDTPSRVENLDVYVDWPHYSEYINDDFYDARYQLFWETISSDEELIAELTKKIRKRYKVIRRLYFELFHSHKHYFSITHDLSKNYEYFDIITTLREGSEFVQTTTNSVKLADISRKPFIKNGKSIKLKKYPIAA